MVDIKYIRDLFLSSGSSLLGYKDKWESNAKLGGQVPWYSGTSVKEDNHLD